MKRLLSSRFLVILAIAILLVLSLVTGCGKEEVASQPEEAPVSEADETEEPEETPVALETESDEEDEPEEVAVVEEEEPEVEPEPIKLILEDTIVFPEGFTIEDVISISEVEELVIDSWYYYYPKGTPDAAEKGKPIGGFKRTKGKGDSEIAFTVDVNSTKDDFERMRVFVDADTLEELDHEIWDEAYVGIQSNGKAIVTVLRGDVAMNVTWNPEFYSRYDNTELAKALAILFVNNLYGGDREQVFISEKARKAALEIPEMDPSLLEGADPKIPDSLPADLNDTASLSKYATDLSFEYVGVNKFVSGIASDADKASARKALKLIIEALDKAIELYDENESLYYNRGTAYAELYYDSGHWGYRVKALADLEKAMDMGLEAAKLQFDELRGK